MHGHSAGNTRKSLVCILRWSRTASWPHWLRRCHSSLTAARPSSASLQAHLRPDAAASAPTAAPAPAGRRGPPRTLRYRPVRTLASVDGGGVWISPCSHTRGVSNRAIAISRGRRAQTAAMRVAGLRRPLPAAGARRTSALGGAADGATRLVRGYRSGCSSVPTSRSTSRSGQYSRRRRQAGGEGGPTSQRSG